MTAWGRHARRTWVLAPVVLVMLPFGCGGGGERTTPSPTTSTSVVHDATGTVPGPGPTSSELIMASPSLQVPIAGPGERVVVTWGAVSDGAVVAVVRNMTQERLTDAAVAATPSGGTAPVGPPGVVVPPVLNPGEWGMALLVLDQPTRGELEFEITRASEPRTGLAVQSAERRDDGVAGTVGNPTAQAVTDVIVDVVCFSRSRPATIARLRPVPRLEAGATASFSATIRDRACATWAAVASGSAGK